MIALVATGWASSWGLLGGTLATRGPARHDVAGAWGTWVRGERGAWSGTVDLMSAARTFDGDPFVHRSRTLRLTGVVGPGAGSDVAHTGIGVGPAAVLRWGRAGDHRFTVFDPGLRVLGHLDATPLDVPLVIRLQAGTTMRGIRQWDVDVLVGMGVAW